MSKKYCECGSATDYSVVPPKFCANCGKNFLSAFASTPTSKPKIKIPKSKAVLEDDYDDEEEDDDDDYEYEAPRSQRRHARHSSFDTDEILAETEIAASKYSGTKIENIGSSNGLTPLEKPKGRKQSKKQVLENFKAMATPKRESTEIA